MGKNINTKTINVLLVDDDSGDRRLIELVLARPSDIVRFNMETAETLSEAGERLSSNAYDIVLLDLNLPDSTGINTVTMIRRENPDVPIVVLTGLADEEMGIEAIRNGAEDYVIKGKRLEYALARIIRYAIERRRTEKALRKSEGKLNAMLQSIGDHMSMMDKDLNIIWANNTARKLFGNDIVGKKCYQTYHRRKEPCQPYPCITLKAFADGKSHEHDTQVIGKDGETIYFHCTSNVALRDKDGNPTAVLEVSRDITESKRAERQLRESEQRYHLVLKGAGLGTWDWNMQTDEAQFNTRWAEMKGYSLDEIKPHLNSWKNLVHPDDLPGVYEILNAHLEGKTPFYEAEFRMRHKSGDWLWILDKGKVVERDKDGKPIRAAGTHLDITERKRAEQELKQLNRQLEASVERANLMTQEAVMADLAKSQFLANMSHEIRTPMNAIIGFSEVLSEEELAEEQKHYVDIIRESAENLLQLVNDILDFSKMEAGKLSIEIIDCPLEHLFAVVESLMRPSAIEKGLEFGIRQCGQLPANIRTDPVRLRQCLINLINNAIKFTEKGHVCVSVSRQEIDNQPYIRFDVEDTGIGIAADKQKEIFNVFTQTDSTDTRKYGGTGLGLAITKQLTQLLNGRITLTSEKGKGSVFSLIVPAGVDVESQPAYKGYRLADELKQEPPDAHQQHKFSGTVLVAEDSLSNQVLIRLLLERLDLEVTIAADGKEAVDKALSQPFDLIFMDMQMPNMNGYSAAKKLRKNGITTPIVALTAHAMKGDRQKCIFVGCNDYLPKPINRKDLLRTIRKYLPCGDETLTEKIESVKSEADQLSQLCFETTCQQAESAEPANEQPCEVPVDWSDVISICDNEDIVKKVAKVITQEGSQIIESLAEAIRTENSQDIRFYAHKLKGTARHIGATQLYEKASHLECAGQEKDIKKAAPFFGEVKDECERLLSFLSEPDWIEAAKQQANGKQVERPMIR